MHDTKKQIIDKKEEREDSPSPSSAQSLAHAHTEWSSRALQSEAERLERPQTAGLSTGHKPRPLHII